jgi:hypothetical protein
MGDARMKYSRCIAVVDVSNVDILEESKGTTLEGIKQDLQRELNSDTFAYYQDQVKLAAEGNSRSGLSRPRGDSRSQQDGNQTPARSRSRDRKRSSTRSGERDGNPAKGANSALSERTPTS